MVVGHAGRLGRTTLMTLMQETPHEVLAVGRNSIATTDGYEEFDSGSMRAWKDLADQERWRADVVINTAAMTDVDRCETEREQAWRTNVDLVESILWYCRKTDARLIQLSTDYVFDGDNGPYLESTRPEPINYYGRTKLAAENLCTRAGTSTTVVRTMWLYGGITGGAPSFSRWVRDQLETTTRLRIVGDEYGNPTTYDDLAHSLSLLAENDAPPVIHVAGTDRVSRAEWAAIIAETDRYANVEIETISSADLERPARRPLNSGLITLHPQLAGITELTGVRKGERNYRVMSDR